MATKKLIEVALPLEKINAESAREKSIRHGHPSTLHLWWARRPLAAARAVIWASLVDDPSSHPEKFPTEEEQNQERQRLFRILEDLVVWENSNNEQVLEAAKAEIMKSTGGNPPELLDPFAGGGAIPLEAQRLGLKAHAHDLNPVAVMINKAMIEIPPRFAGMAPVNPDARTSKMSQAWSRAQGLAEDVRYYGEWMKQEAFKRIGHLYPKVKVPREQGGGEATVIAWIWARTVKCPNPACGVMTPLVKSFVLSKKKGQEAWAEPVFSNGRVHFVVHTGEISAIDGTVKRSGATCACCGANIPFSYIREEGKKSQLLAQMMAVVAEGKKQRIYITPDETQLQSSNIAKNSTVSLGTLAYYPGYINPVAYGLEQIEDLFSPRQFNMLLTLSDLIETSRLEIEKAAILRGMENDHIHLRDGGTGALAYSEAVSVYLSFAVDRQVDLSSTISSWINSIGAIRNTFGMTGISMSWDYAEANPFSNSTGCFSNMINWVYKCVNALPATGFGIAIQSDAQSDSGLRNIAVSTDPPYYSNVPYADFSDLFYSWMRRSQRSVFPNLFSVLLTPKAEELVADPYRHGSKCAATEHFEKGMLEACKRIYESASDDIPVTIYYAFKQTEADPEDKNAPEVSTGWETILTAIIKAGFSITGTWPIRTERTVRTIAQGANALASSIVLVCRKRPADAISITRRNFTNLLRKELHPALKALQDSNIAPVDLAQSSIGPGIAVFSRYGKVLEADGTIMTVRSALKIINQELDLYFNEQDGDMDSASRFCVDLYIQSAFNDIKYGEAEILATAKSTSIPMMASHGILYAKGGIVHLFERSELPETVDTGESCVWMLTQQLTQAMAKGGVEACAKIVANMFGSNGERAKDLAYRLYTIAERKNWANEAYAYNALVVSWPDIQARAAVLKKIEPEQLDLFSTGMLDT